jgi:hypothetical protein
MARPKIISPRMASPGSALSRFGIPALLIGFTLLVFYAVPGFGFVNWDDMIYVYENPWIRDLHFKNIYYLWTHFYPKENYHPLVMMSYLVEYAVDGLNPGVFHSVSLLFHLANVWLVYHWLRLWNTGWIIPGIAALLFAIHPLHVESVCWISDRKDLMMTMFSLLSLIQYHQYKQGKGKEGWVLFWFIAALLSKTSAAVLPLVFFILDEYLYAEAERTEGWISRAWRQFREKWVFWILAVIFTIVVARAQKSTGGIHPGGIEGWHWVWRPFLNIATVSLFYLKKFFIPLHLINQYSGLLHAQLWNIPVAVFAPIGFVLLCFAVLFSGLFTWKIRFGFLLTFAISLPYLQWVPLGHSLVWDRYFYLGSIGVCWLMAEGFQQVLLYPLSQKLKMVIIACVLIWISWIGLIAWRQTFHWKDGVSLWSSNLKRQPTNLQALQNLYRALKARGDKEEELYKVLKKGLAMYPKDYVLNHGMGEYYFEQAEYTLAREYFIESILSYSGNRDAYYLLAQSNLKLQDTTGYIEQLRIAEFMGHKQAKLERMVQGQ